MTVTTFFFQDYPITLDNNFCYYVDFLTIWLNKSVTLLSLFHPSTPIVMEKERFSLPLTANLVKLPAPAYRQAGTGAGPPGKDLLFHIVPLDPAHPARGGTGHLPVIPCCREDPSWPKDLLPPLCGPVHCPRSCGRGCGFLRFVSHRVASRDRRVCS